MRNCDIQTVHTLVVEELPRHWDILERPGIYEVFDGYSQRFVKQAVNFVIGEHHRSGDFNFADITNNFDWIDQGRLAIISMFLMEHRDTFNLSEEMVERAHHLMQLVRDSHVPKSLLRVQYS